MAKKKSTSTRGIILLIILHVVGLCGFAIPALQSLFIKLVPWHLLVSLGILLYFHTPWRGKFVLAALGVMLAGFGVEWLGVETGVIFGSYTYGETLGYKVLEIPLLIGVNWFILLNCSLLLSEKITPNKWLKCMLTGIFMVLMDILIEPVAIHYDYWHWAGGTIPIQNYIAWGIIGFIMALAYNAASIKTKNPVAIALFCIQLVFFMAMNILL